MRSLALGEPIKVRNPSATRPWQHVIEPYWLPSPCRTLILDDPHLAKLLTGPGLSVIVLCMN